MLRAASGAVRNRKNVSIPACYHRLMETFNVIAGVGALIAAAGTLFNSWQIFRLTGRVDHLTGRVDHLTGRVDELSRAVHVR